jgi:hypothetical protein
MKGDEIMSDYINEKIDVLKQLGIKLTKEQKNHMCSLTSEIAIDNYAHDLIMKRVY